MRFAVEAWAPEYGAVAGDELLGGEEPHATVDRSIERSERTWAPIRPTVPPPARVGFVDGVTRVDAQVWIQDDEGELRAGLCTTAAAGAVVCGQAARIADVRVERTLLTASRAPAPIVTPHATYQPLAEPGEPEKLAMAAIKLMRALEARIATEVTGADLVVLDGLLWGREDVEAAIGYIKSHRSPYLPAALNEVVGALAPGERTPVFLVSTTWTRFSWYLRLPGGGAHPWSGIVRCEASQRMGDRRAVELADLAAAALPRFASTPHKEPRAPQNLYPIAGLERELRRRSGDAALLYRSLLAAAAGAQREGAPGRSPIPVPRPGP